MTAGGILLDGRVPEAGGERRFHNVNICEFWQSDYHDC